MAVSASQLVKDQLDPVLLLDPTLEVAIPRQVEAQTALRGWGSITLSDQQIVQVSMLTVKALIPRLLLKFAQEVKKAKGARAEVDFQNAIDFLKALQDEVNNQLATMAGGETTVDAEGIPVGWPSTGVMGF
jgi:hypothetical protein